METPWLIFQTQYFNIEYFNTSIIHGWKHLGWYFKLNILLDLKLEYPRGVLKKYFASLEIENIKELQYYLPAH